MFEFFMIAGLGMMFIMVITLSLMVCRLSNIQDEIVELYRKLNSIYTDVSSIRDNTFDIDEDLERIYDLLHPESEEDDEDEDEDEDEDDENDDESGYNIEVAVLDELPIHLITPEQYHFGNGYSKNELKYYPNTDLVKYFFDEDTCLVMEDVPEYIGDGLVFFGMHVKEPNVVYVRNHILNADFRIEKVDCTDE